MKLRWKSCLQLVAAAFLLYLLIHYWPAVGRIASLLLGAAAPLIIGCAAAYIVNILMSFYEKHYFKSKSSRLVEKSHRPLCMLAAFLSVIGIVTLVLLLVVPQLAECVSLVFAVLPAAMDKLIALVMGWDILPQDILATLSGIDWQARFGEIMKTLTSGVGSVVDMLVTAVSSVFSGLVTSLLALIFAIYLLSGKETLASQAKRLCKTYLSEKLRCRLGYVLSTADDCFHRYIVGQCTEAVILGLLCTVGMLILRLPYATMIGALVAFTALIPVAGAYIGAAVGAFMILTVAPMKALVFIIFLVVLQQLEGNIIYPKVVGSSMGLPAIWVLAAVTVGGGVMGVAGMLLGVPLATTVYRLIRDDVQRKEALQTPSADIKEEAVQAHD